MDTSHFIARVLGAVLFVVYIGVLYNLKTVKSFQKAVEDQPFFIFLTGFLALTAGALIVNAHNVWVADWQIAITLFGWLALLSGIIRVVFIEAAKKINQKLMSLGDGGLIVISILLAAFGAYLFYMGYRG